MYNCLNVECFPVALANTGLNVVCNQEYAQAVSHVSFNSVCTPVAVDATCSTRFIITSFRLQTSQSLRSMSSMEAALLPR